MQNALNPPSSSDGDENFAFGAPHSHAAESTHIQLSPQNGVEGSLQAVAAQPGVDHHARWSSRPQCGRDLTDRKRQPPLLTAAATSPPTMWTAASSKAVTAEYALQGSIRLPRR